MVEYVRSKCPFKFKLPNCLSRVVEKFGWGSSGRRKWVEMIENFVHLKTLQAYEPATKTMDEMQ